MNNKKGAFGLAEAPQMVLLFGLVVLITAAVGVGVTSFRSTQTANSYAYNISSRGLTGLDNFSQQTPTIGTILGVSLIIVIIVGAFAVVAMRGGSV